jgi:hypothetical protein
MNPIISHDRFDLAVVAAVASVFAVCVVLEGIAWLRRRPRFNRTYRAAISDRPALRPGRPGRVHLRVVGKPPPDERDSIQQFRRRTS